METIKSPRFWITIAAMISVTVLAALKVVSEGAAIGLLSGMMGGWGIAKVNAGDLKKGAGLMLLAAAMGSLLVLGGCATLPDGSGKTLDRCKAVTYATGAHALAAGISALVCTFLPKENRAACLRAAAAGKAAGATVIEEAAPVIKACGITP